MLFDSWSDLIRIVAVGVPAYVALLLILRLSGKRTLSKLNAFDLVITVAMGSTLANILLSPEVSLAEGMTALGLLVLLQSLITWTSVRSQLARKLAKSEPTLLFYRNEFLRRALVRERVTPAEIRAAARAHGFADLTSVEAIVLETDGSISAVSRADSKAISTLEGVQRRSGDD